MYDYKVFWGKKVVIMFSNFYIDYYVLWMGRKFVRFWNINNKIVCVMIEERKGRN